MSSFLVSDETINIIITGMSNLKPNFSNYPFLSEFIVKFGDTDNNDWEEQTGIILKKLNHLALKERYNDKIPRNITHAYEEIKTNNCQFLKSLQCLLYQCSEGKVMRKKIYLALRELEQAIKEEIIQKLPDYKNTVWEVQRADLLRGVRI